MRRVFFKVLAFTAFTALLAGPAFSDENKAGEEAFNKNCGQCHGIKGSGTDKGPPLVHVIYRSGHHSDLSFRLAVQNGVRAHHWRFGDMSPVEGVAGNEIEEIIKYIRTLQREAGIF
ncbi:MAG: cytochrome c [Deltaproteobacteria bacterium]